MNPNHYLAVAISYLFRYRPNGARMRRLGKTVVSSGFIDRVTAKFGRRLIEVPVGFKWFVDGLLDGSVGFGGEESAGASFLRMNGEHLDDRQRRNHSWPPRGRDNRPNRAGPRRLYSEMTREFGAPVYERIDVPATAQQKEILKAISPDQIHATSAGG